MESLFEVSIGSDNSLWLAEVRFKTADAASPLETRLAYQPVEKEV
jgi:hypothetical protein